MSTILRVTAALALAAACLPALAASATVTRAWQFKPASLEGLELRNLVGDVRVEGADVPGVHVTARATVEADSQGEAERLAGLVDFRTRDTGPGSRFEVRLPREHFPKVYAKGAAGNWFTASYVKYLGDRVRVSGRRDDAIVVRVDLLIRAPAGSRLDVSSLFGDAEASKVAGELKLDGWGGELRAAGGEGRLVLDSGSGRVLVNSHRGRVHADTGSGSVSIADCECEITADTGSGSVEIRNGRGSVQADTGSGSVTIEGFSGPISADTGSGSVLARAVTGVTELDVDTGSGSVTVEGDLANLERLRVDTGSGRVRLRSSALPSMEIRVDTGSGNVDVDAPESRVRKTDGRWIVQLGAGAHSGVIDTGSGSVDIIIR